MTFQTNCGSFTIRLDQAQSPNAAASFASLVEHGFFDNTIFHRIAVGFVIQGGDPTQTGSGGPGYATVDRRPPSATYTHGVVAMAKTGTSRRARPAASSSSSPRRTPDLPPDYAIIGKVTRPRRRRPDRQARRRRASSRPRSSRSRRPRVASASPVRVISAVVLAAGAATRFGSPKQLLLLPYVLERLRGAPVDEIVIVSGAYPIEESDTFRLPAPASSRARTGRAARGKPSLRPGALGDDVEAALVVLADGPYLDPRAVERVLAHRGEAEFVAASYDGVRSHPAVLARPRWSSIPDDGGRGLDARLIPCDDLTPPGDIDTPDRADGLELGRRRSGAELGEPPCSPAGIGSSTATRTNWRRLSSNR